MNIAELIKTKKEEKLIKLLKRNKLDIRIEEILIKAIDFNKNNLVRYIIDNYNIDYNYKNEIDYDLISVAVISGNIEIINLLKNKGINLEKKYKYNNKSNTIISLVRDLDTLKYLEKYIKKEKIKKEVNSIVRSTILSHDIELLDYIIKNYKINIKRIKYETQNKKYSLIDITEEVLQGMKNREFRKREFAIYISDLLKPSHKYKKIINNAFNLLKEIEEENILIENYYKYLKQYY